MNSLWFVGDGFLEKSFGRYFQSNSNLDGGHIRNFYESKAFAGYEKCNRSYIGQVHNSLVTAINENSAMLPRYIVVTLDTEMINASNYSGFGFTEVIKRLFKWLANQIDRIIRATKEIVPQKSKRKFEPQILWIGIPEHRDLTDNYRRRCTNDIIAEVLEEFQDMKLLKPIKN